MTRPHTPPPAQGLYDPAQEHGACGVCFVVDIKGRKSRRIIDMAITGLEHLSHRGACVSLPPAPIQANHCETQFEAIIRAEGCEPLGWREMPSDLSPVGATARA